VRGVKILAATLGLLLLVAVAGLWWWSGTEGSLEWTLRRIAQSQPLSAEGVQGSLRDGLRVKRLQWKKDGLEAEADDVYLEWQPLALFRGQVKFDHVSAASVRVKDSRPPQPKAIPVSLALPIQVVVGEAKVQQLQWTTGGNTVQVANIAGHYSYNGADHKVQMDNLDWSGGSYRAHANVGAGGALPVDATLEGRVETAVPGSDKKLPLTFTATLRGPLADLQANAVLQTRVFTPTTATRATATARITPWAEQPVPEGQAEFRQLDLSALWSQAPQTSLGGQVRVQPAGTGTWALTTDFRNELPGPWDQKRLPVQSLSATGEWRASGQAVVRTLEARVGEGQLKATGQWKGTDGWVMESKLAGINPAALYSGMAALPVSGRADATGDGKAISFDVDLTAEGGRVKAAPARKDTSDLAAALGALELRRATARGRWNEGVLSLRKLDVRTSDASLQAAVDVNPRSTSGSGSATLEAPGLQARVEGKLAESSGGGTARVASANLGPALAWLKRLPMLPAALRDVSAAGRGELQVAWQGGWRDPAVQASLAVPLLELKDQKGRPAGPEAVAGWTVRDAVATVGGRLSQARIVVRGRAELGPRKVAIELGGNGGRTGAQPVWQGQVQTLNVSASDPAAGPGTWTLRVQRPFDIRSSAGSVDVSASEALLLAPPRPADRGRAALRPTVLTWEPVRWRTGELRTAGRLTGLPMAWIELVGGPQLAGAALSGDMVFDAQWNATLGAVPRIEASIARSSGDVSVLAENTEGGSTRVRAGVREARLSLLSQGEAVTATLVWDSERGGTARGRVATRLTQGGAAGWEWADGAPLTGAIEARLPRIGVWSLLAPPGWRLRGSMVADLAVGGTKGDPQLSGTLVADDLALRSVVDGIQLQGGQLRARLDGRRLVISEFVLHGPGEGTAGGTLRATGEGTWTAAGIQARLTAQLTRLRASIRSDRQVTVSGDVAARMDSAGTQVTGNLKVDQARIVLPDQGTPQLGDDVIVRGADGPVTPGQARASQQAARPAARPMKVAVNLDLGNDFRVEGLGIDTRLQGTLVASSESISQPRLTGTIQAVGGEYRAYGQRLNIERGVVRFTGPIDNPALDILALRPNMLDRVGVMVTGRALAPYVRLYSEPEMPDVEKLSLLVTGRRSPSGGAEAALVQQAALALLASRGGGGKRGVAAALGLDELSFKRNGADGPAVTLGKRFGRNFYAAYERSLSGALGTLFIFYDLTRRLTLRAEAGEGTAVDLIFTFAFD
jgi:translocation and assembly module TamB